ncbi:MAG: bacillithiol system redox-active protein YtxJ [Flavobacteriia bacterium]|jgi:bacillithiol system protein YtxJ|nr:bacillithiol system redox-active protein YtxJ [Flavobacteriia bacterium]
MSWKNISEPTHWQELLSASQIAPQLVFKHSTRCSISSMVLNRFESSALFQHNAIDSWYLDLIAFRDLSNLVATDTQVWHESPQCIVIDKNKVIYAESHGSIDAKAIEQLILDK